jgi:phage terminase small subunit
MALRPKQQRFVEEYCTDWNATQAAIRAGYRAKRARQIGYENLTKPDIQAAIQARQQALQGRCEVTQERVVQELAGIAFSDLRHYVQWGPDGVRLEPSATLTPAHSRVVKQVVETVTKEGQTLRITLHDKVSALDKLARHLGLYQGQDPEEPFGKGMLRLVEALHARQQLKAQLAALAVKARANGQGEGGP